MTGLADHHQQIRQHLGFRECSAEDADKLTAWLATHVCEAERQRDAVQSELLSRCRAERLEPPTARRAKRIVRPALHAAETAMSTRSPRPCPPAVAVRQETAKSVTPDPPPAQ